MPGGKAEEKADRLVGVKTYFYMKATPHKFDLLILEPAVLQSQKVKALNATIIILI